MKSAKRSLHKSLGREARLWDLVSAAGVVVSAATVLGFFGRFGWYADLFSHFRVQYLLALTAITIILLVGRRHMQALAFGIVGLVNLATVLSLYFGGRQPDQGNATVLRVILVNVNTELGDPARVAHVVEQYDPDLIVLEEVNLRWLADLANVLDQYPYSTARPRDDNFGITLYSKLPFRRSEIVYVGDAEVPSVVCEIDAGDASFTVIGTHPLPPARPEGYRYRNRQLAALPAVIEDAKCPVLLLGDLNVTPWNYHFRRLVRDSGLMDSSRGHGVQPTWPTYTRLLRIPIDHCLHSPQIQIVKREIGPDVGSDHFPLIVDFVLPSAEEEKGTATRYNG
jgi:endonuclease/exonuclease/phosphatase (EEP) superfamily protein YafD